MLTLPEIGLMAWHWASASIIATNALALLILWDVLPNRAGKAYLAAYRAVAFPGVLFVETTFRLLDWAVRKFRK